MIKDSIKDEGAQNDVTKVRLVVKGHIDEARQRSAFSIFWPKSIFQ